MQLVLDDLISIHLFVKILDYVFVHFDLRLIGLMHAVQLLSELLVLAFQTDIESCLIHFGH